MSANATERNPGGVRPASMLLRTTRTKQESSDDHACRRRGFRAPMPDGMARWSGHLSPSTAYKLALQGVSVGPPGQSNVFGNTGCFQAN
jgi:hypothetical protein